MRFRIEAGWGVKGLKGLCQIRWQETVIPVRIHSHLGWFVSHYGVHWIWPNGIEYTLMYPIAFRIGETPEWNISSSDGRNCVGRMIHLPLRKTIVKVNARSIEWDFDGARIVEEGIRCCTRQLRQGGGRRLALWHFHYNCCAKTVREGVRVEGVWRNSLPESTVPVIVGMILATVDSIVGFPSGP